MQTPKTARRGFLKTAGCGMLAASLTDPAARSAPAPQLAAPKLTLNVRDFGASGDGVTKDTAALQLALDRCWVLGGGEVLLPAGNYLTGAIAIRSNTILRLAKDATISGSPDFADYPVTQVRWEGKWVPGHIALIYSLDASHMGIVGPGKILGNAALAGRPSADHPLRHPAVIETIGCHDVRFEDFSAEYQRMWCLHATYCENAVFRNLTIRTTGTNGDGIDIDSCKHVRIEGCDIVSGDDCISIKSGRGSEAYTLLQTSEDVRIANCVFTGLMYACIGIGSETSGGIFDVRIDHCTFAKAQKFAIYIKSRPGRGAFIEDIVASDLDVSAVTGGFLRLNILDSGIQDQDPVPGNEGIPTIKNFRFSNVRVKDCATLVDGTGIHPNKPLDGFSLVNVTGECSKGITLANIRNAEIRGIQVTGYSGPLIGIHNVSGTGLEGAAEIDGPKLPSPVPAPAKPYVLH
jgi:polygalacturonase